MTKQKRVFYMLFTLGVLIYAPYIAIFLKYHGIQDKFFNFPAISAGSDKPDHNPVVSVTASVLFIAVMLLLIFPRIFGFKKAAPTVLKASKAKVRFPFWFWLGAVSSVGTVIFLFFHLSKPAWLNEWALIPLWWGFIYMLDALVYYRNGGVSLASNAPTELISMAVLSISGWLIFEYFNFFIRLNWYYPFANLISHDKFLLYAVAGSSAFIPMAFEWYQLLRTFQSLNVKYKFGPKVRFSKGVRIGLLILSVVGMIASSYHPNNLFYVVWLAPLTILTIVLGFLGIWTPFISIRDSGDWSSLLIFAPAFLIQGVFLECANYLSAEHLPSGIKSSNPGFWEYCIPYVKSWRIFEMPLLGYLGYIPFSIYCWIWFISMAFLMNISTSFSLNEDYM